MLTVKALNKNNLKSIETEIKQAIAEIESKYGIQARFVGGRYTDKLATMKLEVSVLDESGKAFDKYAEQYNQYKGLYGFTQSLGDMFTSNGRTYKLTGLNRRNSKYPVLGELVGTGAKYKFPTTVLKPANKFF